jgi:phosphoglycolate phosphatase
MENLTGLDMGSLELYAFDWSGVVSDDRKPVYFANMMLFEHYGIKEISFDEWLGRTTLTPVEILRNHGCTADADEIWELYKKFFTVVNEIGTQPFAYNGAPEALAHLKEIGKKLAVLSSHPDEKLREEVERYGINPAIFDQFQGSAKDKVTGLIAICLELEVTKPNALYLGDTVYDIRAAKQAGLRSAAVCGGYHLQARLAAEEPDIILEDGIAELVNL